MSGPHNGPILIVVAHPDDETLAFFDIIRLAPGCIIVHATDGSPYNLRDAQAAGFHTRETYAAERKSELQQALGILGGRQTRSLGFVDQETWRHLSALTGALESTLRELQPSQIFTHPYEGGHPDHDSVAFAVSRARKRLAGNVAHSVAHQEGAFYHRFGPEFRPGEFLESAEPVTERHLSSAVLEQKIAMLNCFASQQPVLSLFNPAIERFRPAPAYDFTAPPHPGTLNYEAWGWAVTGGMWREAARRALSE